MAIFGTGSPKIITSASVEITLTCAKVLKDEPVFDNIIHENPVSGERVFLAKGYRWEVQLMAYIYKDADPKALYTSINTALYDEVTYYRHLDAEPVCDSGGSPVTFWLKKITPVYVETVTYKDALILDLVSLKYVDLSKAVFGYISDDTTGGHLVDDETGGAITTG